MSAERIGIIGAGKLGCSFASALVGKGYSIGGIYSKSNGSQEYLCHKLGLRFENDLLKTVSQSDVIFITVPDSQIRAVADHVAEKAGCRDICKKYFFHMSGALTSDELGSIGLKGGYTGSLHPIQTFAERDPGEEIFKGVYFGFEGCDEVKNIANAIISALEGHLLNIKKEDKPVYHAAACVLSNYTVTLSCVAGGLLNRIGIDAKTGTRALMPLLENTLKNIKNSAGPEALTGPVSRGDINVIEGHIKALGETEPNVIELYRVLGAATVEVALAKGSIDENAAGKLKRIFNTSGTLIDS
jgi:predicted short-subunit dehydrogenase-like oxidoreductase (DUF2520 family)